MIVIDCLVCFKEIARYDDKKSVPKTLKCPHCHLTQPATTGQTVSHSRRRNYPQGFWENQ